MRHYWHSCEILYEELPAEENVGNTIRIDEGLLCCGDKGELRISLWGSNLLKVASIKITDVFFGPTFLHGLIFNSTKFSSRSNQSIIISTEIPISLETITEELVVAIEVTDQYSRVCLLEDILFTITPTPVVSAIDTVAITSGYVTQCQDKRVRIELTGSCLLLLTTITISAESSFSSVFNIPARSLTFQSNSSIVLLINPTNAPINEVPLNIEVYDAFGMHHSFIAVPTTYNVAPVNGILVAPAEKLFRLATTIAVLAHDDTLIRNGLVAEALQCVSELTKSVPFEFIYMPIALGIPLSTMALEVLKKRPSHDTILSYTTFVMLICARVHIEKLIDTVQQKCKNRGSTSDAAYSEFDEVRANCAVGSQLAESITAVMASSSAAYDSVSVPSWSITAAMRALLAAMASTSARSDSSIPTDEEYADLQEALKDLVLFQDSLNATINRLIAMKNQMPTLCGYTLDVTDSDDGIDRFLSMTDLIAAIRSNVRIYRDQLFKDLKALSDSKLENTKEKSQRADRFIQEAIQSVAGELEYTRLVAKLVCGFIDVNALHGINKLATKDIEMIGAKLRMRGDQKISFSAKLEGTLSWLAKYIDYSCSFKSNAEELFQKRQAVWMAYDDIGEAQYRLKNYSEVVDFFFRLIYPERIQQEYKQYEKEQHISDFFLRKQVTHLYSAQRLCEDFDVIFDPKTSLCAEMTEIDKRFEAIKSQDRFGLCCRLKILLTVGKLRQILGSLKIVGFFGPSGGGKSSTISQLGVNVDCGAFIKNRTPFPGLYLYPSSNEKVLVLDTVGSQASETLGAERAAEVQQFIDDQLSISNIVVLIVPYSIEKGYLNEKLVKKTAPGTTFDLDAGGSHTPHAFITCYNKADLMINAVVQTYEENEWGLPEFSRLLNEQADERNFCLRPHLPRGKIPQTVGDTDLLDMLCCKECDADTRKYPRWVTMLRSTTNRFTNDSYSSFRIAHSPEDVENMRRHGVRMFSDLKVWLDDQVEKL